MSPAPTRAQDNANTHPPVPFARDSLRQAMTHALHQPAAQANPGLLLHKGMTETSETHSTAKSDFIQQLARHPASALYQSAYRRWEQATARPNTRFASLTATLDGRLYIGTERSNALEAGITTQRSHGVPLIPGSAVKGNARAQARAMGLQDRYTQWIFGNDWGRPTPDDTPETDAAGGNIVFHDAWWVPHSAPRGRNTAANNHPFVAEIVTPHHSSYYKGKEPAATDFDSPIPAPQIATHGSFRFVLECTEPGAAAAAWLNMAVELLKETLQHQGLGGKGSSGYGYFTVQT